MDVSQLRGLRGSKRFLKPAALVADVDRFLDAEAAPDRTKDASVGMESGETNAAIGGLPARRSGGAGHQGSNSGPRTSVYDCLVQKSVWATRQLVAREQFHARYLRSVGRFFQLFQYGYPELLPVNDQQFLAALLDESILVGDGVKGQQQFFKQWRRYKKLFSMRLTSTCSMKIVASDSAGCLIECAGTFEGCVTAASLQSVFPSALEDDDLVEQVTGRHFTCPTKTLISLDADGRLVQYDAYSDMFKAMSELLDFDPFRVVTIMENAMISEGSLLLPLLASMRPTMGNTTWMLAATSTCTARRYQFRTVGEPRFV
ncbi:hypothetical protein PHYPSEUDO_005335 [Phytophthora pseudosyringae]|uniref:Uncharacterized protein n=1 Tax=Phytophthora pseudosyringae TaxID=221518 RepID=A0A8T1VPH2_9STRA|nr:hypothetical protein PHYPSEUDO_005335 [Phytophthora pseudosyringae]